VLGVFSYNASGQNGSWTTNIALISPRAIGAAATVGGKVYMVGGGTWSCGVNSILQVYGSTANVWTNLPSMPTARYEFAAAELNGQLYAVGGNPGCGSPGQAFKAVEAYDPVANSWSTKATLPSASWGLGAASVNGKLYVVDGFNNNTYCYDPTTNGWSTKAVFPVSFSSGVMATFNGMIYCVTCDGTTSHTYAYNPTGDVWTAKSPMPTVRTAFTGAALNGFIYVVGGYNSGQLTNVFAYNPQTDTWSSVASLPYPLDSASATAANGLLYVMGGFDASHNTIGSVAVFTPSAVLTNVVIAPIAPVIVVTSNQQFTAAGYFNNGSNQTLTSNVTWTSSSPSVASINTNGVALGLTAGSTTIAAISGSVSNSTILTVEATPVITLQPTNNTVSPNGSVTLSVAATGGGLSYQWRLNGTNITGAISPTYNIPSVAATNVGVYTVVVSNVAGSLTSQSAIVGTTAIGMYAGVIVDGPIGSNYLIQAGSVIGSATNWTTRTNIALPSQPYIYIDYNTPFNSQQFYRAVPQ